MSRRTSTRVATCQTPPVCAKYVHENDRRWQFVWNNCFLSVWWKPKNINTLFAGKKAALVRATFWNVAANWIDFTGWCKSYGWTPTDFMDTFDCQLSSSIICWDLWSDHVFLDEIVTVSLLCKFSLCFFSIFCLYVSTYTVNKDIYIYRVWNS